MDTIVVDAAAFSRTFSLIARHDTQYFIGKQLPSYYKSLGQPPTVPLRNYIKRLRSGEYIAKECYSDVETKYVYLTIGQFSGERVNFEGLTFLDDSIGEKYLHLRVNKGDLVITRSGTVGVVHIFQPQDDKVYIPSHHLAIVELLSREDAEYLRLLLQSGFARAYFWAFSSGKGQKEISNWSIKSIPIPQAGDPAHVVNECLRIEQDMSVLMEQLEEKREMKEKLLYESVRESRL